jgi:transposase
MKKYIVALSKDQRKLLLKLVSTGKASARMIRRARILLKTDSVQENQIWTDSALSKALDVSTTTIQRVRQIFVEEGFDAAIGYSRPQRFYERKIDEEARALLVVFFYTDPPEGRRRWTAKLLADKLTKCGYVDQISHETVRTTLREKGLDICN